MNESNGDDTADPIEFDAGPIDLETLLERDGVDVELMEDLLERAENDPDSITVEEIVRNLRSGAINENVAEIVVTELAESGTEQADRLTTGFKSYLDHETSAVRITALNAGVILAERHPAAVEPFIPPLRDLVQGGEDLVYRRIALEALSHVADSYPDEVSPLVPVLRSLIDDDVYRSHVLDILLAVSAERPEDITDAMPELFAVLEDSLTGDPPPTEEELAATADSVVGSDDPSTRHLAGNSRREEFDEIVRQVEEAQFQRDMTVMDQKIAAAATLTNVADRDPEQVVNNVDTVVELLASEGPVPIRVLMADLLRCIAEWRPHDHPEPDVLRELGTVLETSADFSLQGRAALVLALVGDARTDLVVDVIRSRVPMLVELLRADEPETRHAAAMLLSFIAEREPEYTMNAKEPLLGLLDDDHVFVRGSAIWALRYLGGEDVSAALETVATSDPDENIRDLASDVKGVIGSNGDAGGGP